MKAKWLLSIVAAMALAGPAQADELDEVLKIEAMTENPAVAAAETVAEGDGPEAAPAAAAADLSGMTRRELEAALRDARAEIDRLKNIVKRILVANRRERASMYYNMGCVYHAAGQAEHAEEAFLHAVRLNPSDAGAHYNLGILYEEELRMPERARQHYETFLRLAPDDEDADRVYEWLTARGP